MLFRARWLHEGGYGRNTGTRSLFQVEALRFPLVCKERMDTIRRSKITQITNENVKPTENGEITEEFCFIAIGSFLGSDSTWRGTQNPSPGLR